jgi:hypothetical protein
MTCLPRYCEAVGLLPGPRDGSISGYFRSGNRAFPCTRPPVLYAAGAMAKPASEPHLPPLHRPSPLPKGRPKQPAVTGVLPTQLARHLDLSRQRIQQLVDEKVIPQLPSGRFDMDGCRVAYLRWLRAPERRVAKSQVDADFTAAKAELIRLRVAEKKRELIPLEYARSIEDKAIGIVLTTMAGMASRIAGSDLVLRRRVDEIVYETRKSLAAILTQLADEAGEPPLMSPTTDDTPENS